MLYLVNWLTAVIREDIAQGTCNLSFLNQQSGELGQAVPKACREIHFLKTGWDGANSLWNWCKKELLSGNQSQAQNCMNTVYMRFLHFSPESQIRAQLDYEPPFVTERALMKGPTRTSKARGGSETEKMGPFPDFITTEHLLNVTELQITHS